MKLTPQAKDYLAQSIIRNVLVGGKDTDQHAAALGRALIEIGSGLLCGSEGLENALEFQAAVLAATQEMLVESSPGKAH